MKKLNEVIKENPEYAVLIRAVIRNIGKESIEDVINNGIDGGFSGFIYTRDTIDFFHKHKSEIIKLAENMADSLGEDMLNMITGFNCLKDQKLSSYEVAKALESKDKAIDSDHANIKNAMAWFAAEEVCRMFEN